MMSDAHLTADELLAYLDGNDGVVDLPAVAVHLDRCADCGDTLRAVEEDYRLLSSPVTWASPATDDRTEPPAPFGFALLVAAKQRLAAEAAAAERTFMELQEHPVETWTEYLSLRPAELTDALIRRIISAARQLEERDPLVALGLLDSAETVLAELPITAEIATETIGDLWKERANSQMVLGNYPAALTAWNAAAEAYGAGRVADFDLAFVDWGRASVYFEMGDYRAALPLARAARRTFGRFGDTRNAAHVDLLEACILHEEGDLQAAEARYQRLRRRFEAAGDEISLARVLANTACCKLTQGDGATATGYANRAIAIYETFGLGTEIVRTRWALARATLASDPEAGLAALERVAAAFDARGLTTDAAEVRLDVIEHLLMADDHTRASALAREVVTIFARASARVSMVRALAYLRDATAGHRATRELVEAVRRVLAHPSRVFVPPSEPLVQ